LERSFINKNEYQNIIDSMCDYPSSSSILKEPAIIRVEVSSSGAITQGITIFNVSIFSSFACKIPIFGHFKVAIGPALRFDASYGCSSRFPTFFDAQSSFFLR
jgi:hypothetical protein